MATPATQPTTTTNVEDPLRRPIPLNKRYNSTRGDSAAILWGIGILAIASSGMVIAWSQDFSRKFIDAQAPRDYYTSYYTAYAAYIFGIITICVAAIYCGWVFVDGRHPLRDAFQAKKDPDGWKEKQEGKRNNQYSDRLIAQQPPKPAATPAGQTAPEQKRPISKQHGYPGISTFSVDKLNRLAANRLFIKRSHLQKLLVILGIFFIGWAVLFTIFSTKDSYLRTSQIGGSGGTKIASMCPDESTRSICEDLAKTAVTSAVLAGLFLLAIIACAIARPSLNPQKYTTA